MFSALSRMKFNSLFTFILSSAEAFSLDSSKILLFVNQKTFFRQFQTPKCLQRTISNLIKMAEISSNGWKTLWEKEKLLVTMHVTMLSTLYGTYFSRVPRGSVVKCLTRNPGVLGSSRTGSSRFFRGSVHGQDTSSPA